MSKPIFLVLLLLTCFTLEAKEWIHSSGGYKAHRYFEGDQITPSNIDKLERVWKFSSRKADEILTVQSSQFILVHKLSLHLLEVFLLLICKWSSKLGNRT